MKIITIASQKGGAGKTTLALHLSIQAQRCGYTTAVIDIDPQASSAQWGDNKVDKDLVVLSAQPIRLDQTIEELKQAKADLIFIDTAPHSEHSALAAIKKADLVLIPCRPAILDLRAISITIDLVKLSKCNKAAVILNAVPPRGYLFHEASKAIEGLGVEICPYPLTQRTAFMHSLTMGLVAQEYEPKGKAAAEVKKVFNWICKYANI